MLKQHSLHSTDAHALAVKKGLHLRHLSARAFGPPLVVTVLIVAAFWTNLSYISVAAAGDLLVSDVVEYLYWGKAVAAEQSARSSIFIEYSQGIDQPTKVAPGIPVLFATIHALTGWDIDGYPAVLPSLLLAWSIAGLYLVLRHLTLDGWSPVLALALLILGQSNVKLWDTVNPTFARSLYLYYVLSPANAVGFCLLVATFLVLGRAARRPSDTRLYLAQAVLLGFAVISHQLTPLVLAPILLIFASLFYSQLPWRKLLLIGLGCCALIWFARPLYLSFDAIGQLGSTKSTGANFLAATASLRRSLHLRAGLIAIAAAGSAVLYAIRSTAARTPYGRGAVFFSICWLPVLVLALTSTSAGINAGRFENYLWLSLMPAIALGLDAMLRSQPAKGVLRAAWILLLITVVAGSAALSMPSESTPLPTQILDQDEREAARWLGGRLQAGDVVATDIQSAQDNRGIRFFFLNQTLIRPSQQFLPTVPAPYDRPVKALDKILNDPLDAAAIVGGYTDYRITHYFFTRNGHSSIREAVAASPYFAEFYGNEAATIYTLSPLFYAVLNQEKVNLEAGK